MLPFKSVYRTCCLLCLFPVTVFGAEITGPIPSDLVNILLDPDGDGQFGIFDDIPDDFPEFNVPDSFDVIVSLRTGITKRVSMATTLSQDAAEDIFIADFESRGWINTPFRTRTPENGFMSGDDPAAPRPRLCHDEFGQMTFIYGSHGNRTVLTLNFSPNYSYGDLNCAQQREQYARTYPTLNATSGLSSLLPRLIVPDGSMPRNYNPALNNIPSALLGRSPEAQSVIVLNLDWDVRRAFEHFATQISAQGWLQDTVSIGAVSATGIWTKATADGKNLIGTLIALDVNDDKMDMKFVLREG